MSHRTSRRQFLAAAGSATAVLIAGCSGSPGSQSSEMSTEAMGGGMAETESMTEGGMSEAPLAVTVRIENVAPTDYYGPDTSTGGGIWITPGAYAVHTEANPIFTTGEPASIGLEALAEAGPPDGFEGEPGLVDELAEMGNGGVVSSGAYTPENTVADPNDPMGEVPGAPPIASGGAFEFDVEVRPGDRLSFASMFVPSNDVFVSPGRSGIALWPDGGAPVSGNVTADVALWDAGTEENTEPPGEGADQAPAQESPNQGTAEDGVVQPLSEVGDGYDYPPVEDVVRVTLTPHESMSGDSTSEDETMGDDDATATETMGDGTN